MRILFIVPYSSEGASNRFRVEQYLPFLKAEGLEYDVRPFVTQRFFKILYLKGKNIRKILYFIQALWNRVLVICEARKYDLIFIHREACPIGPPIFEWMICKFKKPIIFDFDDAIFLQNLSSANRIYGFLKFPSKTQAIIKMSKAVIVANRFLEEYARRFNPRVHVIPTSIDTEKFMVKETASKRLSIGWVGSPTTFPYLHSLSGVIKELSMKYDFIFKIIGGGENFYITGVNIESRDWKLEEEIANFQGIDIGIYPLSDTIWARGKAAFKAIQFMSMGIPVVASPVGMNKELIQDGVNGFLASSDEEWVNKISNLIRDEGLRQRIGLTGRRTIEECYSVKVNVSKYIDVLMGRA